MTEALNLVAATSREFKKTQTKIGKKCRDSRGALANRCVQGEIPTTTIIAVKTHLLTDRTRIEEGGLIRDNHNNVFKIPTEEE